MLEFSAKLQYRTAMADSAGEIEIEFRNGETESLSQEGMK